MTLLGVDVVPSPQNPGQTSNRRQHPNQDLDAAIERIWELLPHWATSPDARLGSPLRRFLQPIVDQITPIDEITDRGASNVDPAVCAVSWLPWLGQLIGVPVDRRMSVADQRASLTSEQRHTHGSAEAIAKLVRPILTGSRTVVVEPHWRGNRWLVCIRTILEETTQTGVAITSWADLSVIAPTWADLAELPYHPGPDRVRLDIINAATPECPLGVRLCHAYI